MREIQSIATKICPLSCPFFPYLTNIILEVLVRTTRQLTGINGIKIRNEEVKVSLFAVHMIVFISEHKILPENAYSWKIHLTKWLVTGLTKKKINNPPIFKWQTG